MNFDVKLKREIGSFITLWIRTSYWTGYSVSTTWSSVNNHRTEIVVVRIDDVEVRMLRINQFPIRFYDTESLLFDLMVLVIELYERVCMLRQMSIIIGSY